MRQGTKTSFLSEFRRRLGRRVAQVTVDQLMVWVTGLAVSSAATVYALLASLPPWAVALSAGVGVMALGVIAARVASWISQERSRPAHIALKRMSHQLDEQAHDLLDERRRAAVLAEEPAQLRKELEATEDELRRRRDEQDLLTRRALEDARADIQAAEAALEAIITVTATRPRGGGADADRRTADWLANVLRRAFYRLDPANEIGFALVAERGDQLELVCDVGAPALVRGLLPKRRVRSIEACLVALDLPNASFVELDSRLDGPEHLLAFPSRRLERGEIALFAVGASVIGDTRVPAWRGSQPIGEHA